jgi:hypothetical protein
VGEAFLSELLWQIHRALPIKPTVPQLNMDVASDPLSLREREILSQILTKSGSLVLWLPNPSPAAETNRFQSQ